MVPVKCSICGMSLSSFNVLKVHINLHCPVCKKYFMAQRKLKEHMETHPSISVTNATEGNSNPKVSYTYCKDCNTTLPTSTYSAHLRSNGHKNKCAKVIINNELTRRSSVFNGRIEVYSYINKKEEILFPEEFFGEAAEVVTDQLKICGTKHITFKFNVELICDYMKIIDENINLAPIVHISKMMLVTASDDIVDCYKKHAKEISSKMEEFQERDSGWTLLTIRSMEINVNKCAIIRGSQYIPLPKIIAKSCACINVENSDEYCFKWCLIAALYTERELNCRQRKNCNSYDIGSIDSEEIILGEMILNFRGMQFPLQLKQIKKFEKQNAVSINVFGHNGVSIVGPYYITTEEKAAHVNLLLLNSGDRSHYVLIDDISKFLRSSITSHKSKIFVCNSCLYHTHNEAIFKLHKNVCGRRIITMPQTEDSLLKFKNYHKQLDVPFVVYADFESILEKMDQVVSANTTNIQKHTSCAFSYFIKCSFNKDNNSHRYYLGADAAKIFIDNLVKDAKNIYINYLAKINEMVISTEDLALYNRAECCHICKKPLHNDKVRDHCHLTGNYRGAAHNACNLLYRTPKFIPVLFHNLSAYDMHLFFKELSSIENVTIKVIPQNKERYVSLSIIISLDKENSFEIRFLDSFRFISSSLDTLAKNLDVNDFHTVRENFQDDFHFNLIRRKGVFPYSYMDSMSRFEETELPCRDEFFNILNNEECDETQYEHAQRVWRGFNCRTIRDYTELYLRSDVLLLVDIFENFRKICKSIYDLDPCHYYTAPGLSWDAMLKTTKITLELFTDSEMYSFMQNGIRGGLVQCSQRYSRANHKYIKDFDTSKPSEFLMYLDANNLYGWAMSEYLPYGGFEWLSEEEINGFNVTTISETSEFGYILEVDLEYPDSLHDIHNDLPFCPQNKRTGMCKTKKLIADFTFKKNYIIHYRVLKQCILNGLVLKKIHRILEFKQSPWLKKYIDLNTLYRTNARNSFEKDFFKLLNNAVYGKTMENIEKRKDIRIVTQWESTNRNQLGLRSLISKPNFMSLTKFSDEMYAVELQKIDVIYNKPIYIGFTVLELSKWRMYDFHYSYMKRKFGENISLNYMDTDSFIYSIKTHDFYTDIHDDIKSHFDTSEYPLDNPFGLPLLNKKVLGMMKDENKGNIMTEFVGLRSKMYSLSCVNVEDVKKSKGVKKSVVKKLTLTDYKECLLEHKIFTDEMYMFRSKAHQLYTQKLNKVVLTHNDDKRYILPDKIKTRAWGHYRDRIDTAMEID